MKTMRIILENAYEWDSNYGDLLEYLRVSRNKFLDEANQEEMNKHPFVIVYIFQKRLFVQFFNFSQKFQVMFSLRSNRTFKDFSYVSGKENHLTAVGAYDYGQRRLVWQAIFKNWTLFPEQAGLFYSFTKTPQTFYCFPEETREIVGRAAIKAMDFDGVYDVEDCFYGGE